MKHDDLRARHDALMTGWMPLYYVKPIGIERGEGVRVWEYEGNEFLDLFGGYVTDIS